MCRSTTTTPDVVAAMTGPRWVRMSHARRLRVIQSFIDGTYNGDFDDIPLYMILRLDAGVRLRVAQCGQVKLLPVMRKLWWMLTDDDCSGDCHMTSTDDINEFLGSMLMHYPDLLLSDSTYRLMEVWGDLGVSVQCKIAQYQRGIPSWWWLDQVRCNGLKTEVMLLVAEYQVFDVNAATWLYANCSCRNARHVLCSCQPLQDTVLWEELRERVGVSKLSHAAYGYDSIVSIGIKHQPGWGGLLGTDVVWGLLTEQEQHMVVEHQNVGEWLCQPKRWSGLTDGVKLRACMNQPYTAKLAGVAGSLTADQYKTVVKMGWLLTDEERRARAIDYAVIHGLRYDDEYLYAYRVHDTFGRGMHNSIFRYTPGTYYTMWRCDGTEWNGSSFGFGIYPDGNTAVRVRLQDFGVAVLNDVLGKARVWGFEVMK